MRIFFHGAAQTVTGSQHLIEINGQTLLLDCGLFQGKRKESYERNRVLPYEAERVNAVLLSHAHIDHCGNLPHLVKNGYEGPIYGTPATAEVARLMMMDSGKIHEGDAEYVNKKRVRKGEPPVEPLYTIADAEYASNFLEKVEYDAPFEVLPGVQARFVEAGHILGSAAIVLDIEEGKRRFRLWFSGDVGRYEKPLLRDPVMPSKADYLIMECTYGDKLHRDPQQSIGELRDVVARTVERGGKVIIPAFAVGRTQELVYSLNQLFTSGELPRLPVFVDSPLAVNVTDVFKRYTDIFDRETHDFMRNSHQSDVLGFHLLTYVRSVEESKALNDRRDPMIIISASGMAESGRVLHHLAHNIENPKNTVLICSWQAPNTLGRRLADKETQVNIFGDPYQRRAEVATIGGFSAHAGQGLLRQYANSTAEQVKKVFLVHGEPRGANPLMEKLREDGLDRVYYPEPHTCWEV